MAGDTHERPAHSVADHLRSAVWGVNDPRVRATWRVLLAVPILWFLTGGVLTGNVQAAAAWLPSGPSPLGGLTQSLLHGGFFLVALAAWARYLDRRPLSSYGVSASRRWLGDLLVGFAAVVVAFGAWYSLGSSLGWTSVAVSTSAPRGSFLLGLAIVLVALALHVWVQQAVFFRVVLGNAAEGLHSRGVAAPRAVVGGLFVAILSFFAIHDVTTLPRLVDLAVAGGVFGLLYVHTGELALPIGVHLGANYAGAALFASASNQAAGPAVFRVSESLPGTVETIGSLGFPKLVVAYLLVVAWLRWRRGGVWIHRGIARWDGR